MAWKIRNENGIEFNIWFNQDVEGIDIIISCDQKSLNSLYDSIKKRFSKVQDEYRYSRLGIEYGEKQEETTSPENPELTYDESPNDISIEEITQIIKTNRVIFYTGAGISIGTTPQTSELMEDLQVSSELKYGNNLSEYISDVIKNPDNYLKPLKAFLERRKNAKPSATHQCLAKIIRSYKDHLLITENDDQLHQKTGIDPIVLNGYTEYEQLDRLINSIDYVITIGLNSDKSGFLEWFKKVNPKGKIIAINLIDVPYLSKEDFLLRENTQKTIENISRKVIPE
jgi:NAD-dependent SIR2 family protein deacetylase